MRGTGGATEGVGGVCDGWYYGAEGAVAGVGCGAVRLQGGCGVGS